MSPPGDRNAGPRGRPLITRRLAPVVAALAVVVVMLACAATASAAGRCGVHPWCDTSLSPDARAGLLLQALTGDEKISLLGGDIQDYGPHTGASDGVSRVDLPTTYYSDGPVGPRQGSATAMPVPLALAATFDQHAAFRHGDEVGNEVKDKGNDVVFAPTVNIMRVPLGGRTYEAYGEDPYLVTRMTVNWIEGAQSQGVIANVKHLAANNQEGQPPPSENQTGPGAGVGPTVEGNRFLVDANVDERTLREVYLPAFEAAVKEAHVGSIMCSYNRLNGQYACENQHLLNDIVKREWGFQGYVLADYGAAHDTVASLNNGLDFEPFPGIAYSPTAVKLALASGLATMGEVDEHVRRILRTAFAFGFFDRPAFPNDDNQIDKTGHARTAQQIEEEGLTLLRNDGLLPLSTTRQRSIAVIGGVAKSFQTGGGSGNVTPFFTTTALQAITQRAGPGVKVTYDDGSDQSRAASAAHAADVAIVFATTDEGEGSDRLCLSLECPDTHGDQDGLIEKVAAANPNTIVVLETGSPVLTPWRDRVRGLIEAWYPGEEGGPAIARALFGDIDPSGRLPVTFPNSEADIPTAGDLEKYPGVAESETYKEGVFVGYRWYDAHHLVPAYPFGFGLSYTTFRFSQLRIRPGVAGGPPATVSAAVTNTGRRPGIAVPEAYLSLPSPRTDVPQPPRELKGFGRLGLGPGRTRRITFSLNDRAFSYWDVRSSSWQIAPGCYRVAVGSSSRSLPLAGVISRGGTRCASAPARPRRHAPRRRAVRHRRAHVRRRHSRPRFTG